MDIVSNSAFFMEKQIKYFIPYNHIKLFFADYLPKL